MNSLSDTDVPLEGEVIDEISQGIMYAALASSTHNGEDEDSIGEPNPWHMEAVKVITGSIDEAQKPLRDILSQDMDELVLDHEIDIFGATGGHTFDCEGYIAHNDHLVVISLGCTTPAVDWLIDNKTTTSDQITKK